MDDYFLFFEKLWSRTNFFQEKKIKKRKLLGTSLNFSFLMINRSHARLILAVYSCFVFGSLISRNLKKGILNLKGLLPCL